MILAADVTHPGAGGERPSVAALVGSFEETDFKFAGTLRKMAARKELIEEMGAMFKEVYKAWGKRKRPAAIVMFRDGVSEGQFQQVLDAELHGNPKGMCRYAQELEPENHVHHRDETAPRQAVPQVATENGLVSSWWEGKQVVWGQSRFSKQSEQSWWSEQ